MAMGMGIHGEPGVWNGPLKTSREIAEESLNTLLTDMPVADCEEVSILINGLGQLPSKNYIFYPTMLHRFSIPKELKFIKLS